MSATHSDCRYEIRTDRGPVTGSRYTTVYFMCLLVFLNTSGSRLLYLYTRSPTAVHRSLTLPTFQVAEDFALLAATTSFSLQFTASLLAAEHFRLLALRCGTACHRRLRRHHLWRPSALDTRRFCSLSHIPTFGSPDIFVSTHCL